MAFDRDKFKAMVHYICWKTTDNPSSLGATKLNKVCWLADFLAYYHFEHAITDASYVKRPFGPVPQAIVGVLRELDAEGAVLNSTKLFHGYPQIQFRATCEPDISAFDGAEMKLIDRMTKYVTEEHTAQSISDLSHDHIWKAASDGEEMPYFTIFAKPAPITEMDREWAMQELETIG